MFTKLIALATALTLCLAPWDSELAAKSPDKLELAPGAETALMVIKTDWWQPAPNMQSAFRLWFSVFDPVEQKLLGKPFGGSAVFEAKQKNFVDGYLIAEIKPGRWVFQSYSQQDSWSLCFNAASWDFEVKPGEVIYLGPFDAIVHRFQLTQRAVQSGRTTIRGSGFVTFFDLPAAPSVGAIDDDALAKVREMLKLNAPNVTAPVRAAELKATKFGTGSTLFGERVCGGYAVKAAS